MPNPPTGTGSHMAARYWLTEKGWAVTEALRSDETEADDDA